MAIGLSEVVGNGVDDLGAINDFNARDEVVGFDETEVLLMAIVLIGFAILGVLCEQILDFGSVLIKDSLRLIIKEGW